MKSISEINQPDLNHAEFDHADRAGSTVLESELERIFDRYSAALDQGQTDLAEKILSEFPEIDHDFRGPLHGLYLLGRVARESQSDPGFSFDPGNGSSKQRRLGDFEIGPEIGRGGMGIVYAANQISLQRPVALKILPFTAVLDPRHVARFRNEAQAAASLHHPNIVPVYAVGCERGVHYYCMQLIEGQSLEKFLNLLRSNSDADSQSGASVDRGSTNSVFGATTRGSIRTQNYVQRVVEMAAQAAQAIDYAHLQGIVHRDIKPSNLMLDQSGKVWITDFGLARGRGVSNLTAQDDRIGTLRYMSPEQVAGRHQQVDFRTDIYSLGVTLYEMLSLKTPFDGADREEIRAAIENTEARPLRALNAKVSIDLETVINKAMSKDLADRYASANELAEDLLCCLVGHPIKARRPTLLDRLGKLIVRRKWTIAGLALALMVIASAALMVASIFYQQRQREQTSANQARFFLQQAHQAVSEFGEQMADDLRAVPGTEKLQAKLLGKTIGFYDDFLACSATERLTRERALAQTELAALHERAGNDDLALQNYEMAANQLKEIAETKNDQQSDRRELDQTSQNSTGANAKNGSLDSIFEYAVCLNRLGLLQQKRGEFRQARTNFKTALSQFKRISFGEAEPERLRISKAQSMANLGMLAWAEGNLDQANAELKSAIESLKVAPSSSNSLELNLARTKVGGNYFALLMEADPKLAEAELRKGIVALEESLTGSNDSLFVSVRSIEHEEPHFSAREPEQLDETKAHLADMRNNLAILLSKRQAFDESNILIANAIEYWQLRIAKNPRDLEAIESLATTQNTLGEIRWRNDELVQADQAFAKAVELLRPLIDLPTDRPETFSRLACMLHNRALIATGNRQTKQAESLYSEAVEYQLAAVQLAPKNGQYQSLLKSHRNKLNLIRKPDPLENPEIVID